MFVPMKNRGRDNNARKDYIEANQTLMASIPCSFLFEHRQLHVSKPNGMTVVLQSQTPASRQIL